MGEFARNSRKLADLLIDYGLLTTGTAERILKFQETLRGKGEIVYFVELLFIHSAIDPKKFLDFISVTDIVFHPMELFMAHGIITKQLRERAKEIQQDYRDK